MYGLDAVLAQAAKKALRLPLATPTGLVLQQQQQSGAEVESLLIDYAQLSIAHLTRALNDTGKLGIITRSLLQMQHEHLGLHPTWHMGRRANQYRLLKQLELASEAGLYVSQARYADVDTGYADVFKRPDLPKAPSLTLASLADNLHADPRMLGERRPVPLSVYHCLAESGITSLQTLVCKNRKSQVVLIDTTELKRRCGSAVQTRHLKALNKFTILANQGTSGCTISLATVGCAPIASSQWVVHKSSRNMDARHQDM